MKGCPYNLTLEGGSLWLCVSQVMHRVLKDVLESSSDKMIRWLERTGQLHLELAHAGQCAAVEAEAGKGLGLIIGIDARQGGIHCTH